MSAGGGGLRPSARWVLAGALAWGVGWTTPDAASAQLVSVGGRVSRADNETWGVGASVRVGVPLVGLRGEVTGEYFFPDCGNLDCSHRDLALNVAWGFPLPIVDPYLGAGLTKQHSEVEGVATDDVGLNLIAGVGLRHVFIEGRFQIMQDVDTRKVISAGFTFPIT